MQTHRFAPTALALCASALLIAAPAQAATLALGSGHAGGSIGATASVNGQALDRIGSLVDSAGTGFLQAAGSGDASLALPFNGVLRHQWSASALLEVSSGQASFRIASDTQHQSVADGRFDGADESLAVVLDADLAILSTGEADGTPVLLTLSGTARSLVGSAGPALDVVPSFDLVVRDAQSNILGSWQGLAAGANANIAFSVHSRVGDSLQFSLSHGSSLLADAASINDGQSIGLTSSALLSGSISVSAVPEPETYALFGAGLAMLGLVQARSRRAS